MYRVNVSFSLKTQECAFPNEFLRTRLVPLLRDNEDVAQADLLEVMAQALIMETTQPMDDMVLALLIFLEQERNLEYCLSEVPDKCLELLGKTLGKCVLYHVTPMRKITL